MKKEKDKGIPRHVAIIMDGNGRWAKQRGLPRVLGHREGALRVKEIIQAASDLGIEALTLFAFSSENWSRPKKEVETLMRYIHDFLDREIATLVKNNIRFRVIGREKPLPEYLLKKLKEAEDKTSSNRGFTLVLAINYGARQEILDGLEKYIQALGQGKEKARALDEETFSRYLSTAGIPDPDLLIRTSGEMRVSNFLLWQISYAELYFPRVYWPDFKKEQLAEAIAEYRQRQRRFGDIG
jgi:undecaprenyl diphosphate synthase